MGIFDALTSAVSGLSAQAYALQNISGNIANSQTTGYKRINTQFEDLVGDNLPSKQIAGGVLAKSGASGAGAERLCRRPSDDPTQFNAPRRPAPAGRPLLVRALRHSRMSS